jgi:hypothetical protein
VEHGPGGDDLIAGLIRLRAVGTRCADEVIALAQDETQDGA